MRHPDWLERTIQRERATSKQVHLLASYREGHERSVRRAAKERLEKKLQEMDVRAPMSELLRERVCVWCVSGSRLNGRS